MTFLVISSYHKTGQRYSPRMDKCALDQILFVLVSGHCRPSLKQRPVPENKGPFDTLRRRCKRLIPSINAEWMGLSWARVSCLDRNFTNTSAEIWIGKTRQLENHKQSLTWTWTHVFQPYSRSTKNCLQGVSPCDQDLHRSWATCSMVGLQIDTTSKTAHNIIWMSVPLYICQSQNGVKYPKKMII